MSTATDNIARGIANELLRRHRFAGPPPVALSQAEAELCAEVADQVEAQLPDLLDRLPATKAATDAAPIGAAR